MQAPGISNSETHGKKFFQQFHDGHLPIHQVSFFAFFDETRQRRPGGQPMMRNHPSSFNPGDLYFLISQLVNKFPCP
jgi:hypothetical protein